MNDNASEELANSLTHAIGTGLAIAGLALLIFFAAGSKNAWRIVSCAIYGTTLVLLYTASTLYHSFRNPRAKRWLRVFDHCGIYLLIAGTYTPFTLVTLRGPWGWWLFGTIWSLAVFGLVFKLVFRNRFHIMSIVLYVLMGWLAVVAIKPIFRLLPVSALLWLLAGGLFYTIGIVFYARDTKLRFGHAIWHLFVLGGSVCHYIAVLLAVLLTALNPALSSAADDAEELIRAVYKDHQPAKEKSILETKESLLQYFDPSLTDLFLKDSECSKRTGEVCNLDYDPIYNSQEFAEAPLNLSIRKLDSKLKDQCSYEVSFDNFTRMKLVYHLKKTEKGWRIVDIVDSEGGSLKKLLSGASK